MRYLTLLEILGSYVGLGIPLVWRYDNYFLNDSNTKSGTSLTSDWFSISVVYGMMCLDLDGGGGGGGVTPLVYEPSSPLNSNSLVSWLIGPIYDSSPLESKVYTTHTPIAHILVIRFREFVYLIGLKIIV